MTANALNSAKIDLGAGDNSVQLSGSWTKGSSTVTEGSITYDVYTGGSGDDTVTVKI